MSSLQYIARAHLISMETGLPIEESEKLTAAEILQERMAQIKSKPNKPPQNSAEKPILEKERKTLLTIIAALCDYSAIDPSSRDAASQIAKMTDEIGVSITAQTVRTHLAKIPDSLANRSKP